MNCPACDYVMTGRQVGEITVDACDGGCGGVWFDNFELRRVSEAGAQLLRNVARDPMLRVDLAAKRKCPRCAEQPLFRRFYSRLRRTQVDECPNCGGIWLDGGEFAAIQDERAESPDTATLSGALSHTVANIRQRSGM
jgi:hypothetical protein